MTHNGNGHAREALETLEQRIPANVREPIEDAATRVKTFVEERPLVTVAATFAAGFMLGRLMRKWS